MEGATTKLENKFYKKMKQNIKVMANLNFIFEKLEKDGNLRLIQECFETVLNQEITFAVNELAKLQKRSKSFDLRTQLTNNTYIFKENLKTITASASELKS